MHEWRENKAFKRRYHYIIPGVSLILGLATLGALIWSGIIIHKQKIGFLHVDAAMDMQIMLGNFHIEYEFDDESDTDYQVSLDLAMQICDALLNGGPSEHGEPIPAIKDKELRPIALKASSYLKRIVELNGPKNTDNYNSSVLPELHRALKTFMTTTRRLEISLEKNQIKNLADLKRLLWVLAITWLVGVITLSIALYRSELQRKQYKRSLIKSNEMLDKIVRERTAELAQTNEQLRKEIEEHQRSEKNLENMKNRLQSLLSHFHSAQENERTRIAREIHDQLGHILTGLNMEVNLLKTGLKKGRKLEDFELEGVLKSMLVDIEQGIRMVSDISTELRPGILDSGGLIAAIEWQTERFQEKTGIDCEISVPGEDIKLNDIQSSNMFRIFNEVMNNISRHANATRVAVDLTGDSGFLTMRIEDNGKGIAEEVISGIKSFGIMGMRERAGEMGGELRIDTIGEGGTRVIVTIPLFPGISTGEKDYDENTFGG